MLSMHKISNLSSAREFLHQLNKEACSDKWADFNSEHIFENDLFWKYPASLKRHHNGFGGLAVHTAQVCSIAYAIVLELRETRSDLVFTACLWHDIAKTQEYAMDIDSQGNYSWTSTAFKDMERHLARSYSDFRCAAKEAKLDELDVDFVSHLMLAHHGRLDWGSPVEPQCAEAWAVHAADMMSCNFLT